MSGNVQPTEATVLYADDTEAQRYALSRLLRRAGFKVLEASTGRQALEALTAGPDLVMLDVNLPDISGLEVCMKIKTNPETAHIPVLQVSATSITAQARVAGLEGGADAYLIQPIDADELIATVRAMLRVRRAEDALRETQAQYRSFFEANPLACWVFDISDLKILAVNAACVLQYGYSESEFAKLTLRDVVAEDGWTSAAALLPSTAVTSSSGKLWKHRTSKGDLIDVEMVWAPVRFNGRDARLVIVQDVTEKLKRQTEEQHEEVQRLLLERVLHVQEEERQKIARELHDEAGQLMTSLLVGLRTLGDARRLSDAKKQAIRLREIASEAIGELGRLARGLHSSVLGDLGIEAAILRYAQEFSATHGIRVDCHFGQQGVSDLSQETHLHVYRIIQEALTNVARHAKADEVNIVLGRELSQLEVTIRDNGRGLSASQGSDPVRHLGIEGMRQRASMMGGTLDVLSGKNGGVTVRLRVPLATLNE